MFKKKKKPTLGFQVPQDYWRLAAPEGEVWLPFGLVPSQMIFKAEEKLRPCFQFPGTVFLSIIAVGRWSYVILWRDGTIPHIVRCGAATLAANNVG